MTTYLLFVWCESGFCTNVYYRACGEVRGQLSRVRSLHPEDSRDQSHSSFYPTTTRNCYFMVCFMCTMFISSVCKG